MKNHQDGFSVIQVFILVLLMGALGFAGWRVYETKKENKKPTSDIPSANENKIETEEYIVPEGYTLYENQELGFKFAHPKDWGTLKPKNSAQLLLSLEGDNPKTNVIDDVLEVWAAKRENFSIPVQYKGAVLGPENKNNSYVWKVMEQNQNQEVNIGDIYSPQPKVIYKAGDLVVYDFPTAHANATWASWAFAIKNGVFVGIKMPAKTPDIEQGQVQYDTEIEAYKTTQNTIIKTIRIL